ncbi:hypothetical protein ABIA32_003706 [Streptacidiphilus sp. MAP12-20]|uniref:hypothetical protein n=1 Tax=Streptacidiphilus sp. MAP12-20 TaxID=3156299 RepID=UPI0035157543
MRTTIVTAAAAAAATAAVIALSACSSGGGANGTHAPSAASTSSCEAVLVQEFKAAFDAGKTAAPAPTPTACAGIDAVTLQKLVGEATKSVIGQELPSGFPTNASAFPTIMPSDISTAIPSVMPSWVPSAMPTAAASGMTDTLFPSAGATG